MEAGTALLMAIAKIAPLVGSGISKLRGKLRGEDGAILRTFLQRLDERRVFFRSYDAEVFESCLWSLNEVKNFTDEARAAVEDDAAKAALGVILDATRGFLDQWSGADFRRMRLARGSFGRSAYSGPARGSEAFFEDLGELRAVVRLMVLLLHELDPKLVAKNLIAD